MVAVTVKKGVVNFMKRILICCVTEEMLVAEAIQDYLLKSLKPAKLSQLKVEIINQPQSKEVGSQPESSDIVLLLCSPFSISPSPIVHSISGKIDYIHAANDYEHKLVKKSEKIVVIPICFSGLSDGDLPAYISVNQAITIKSENGVLSQSCADYIDQFGVVLCETLNRHINQSSNLKAEDVSFKNGNQSFYEKWNKCWREFEKNNTTSKSVHQELACPFIEATLIRDGWEISEDNSKREVSPLGQDSCSLSLREFL